MRRNLPILIAVLVGLVAGALGAWLLKPHVEQPAAVAPIDEARQDAPATAAGEITPAPVEAAKPAPDPAPVVDTPASAPVAPLQGTGVIKGVVNWADGRPCISLLLVAEPYDPRAWSANDIAGLTPQQRAELYQRKVNEIAANALKATTGADGRFEIAGIGEGKYRVVSGDRNISVFSETGSSVYEAGADVKLLARRSIYIQFEFTFPGGERMQKAVVWLTYDGNRLSSGDSRWWPGREFLVEPRKWKLRVFDELNGLWKAEAEFEVPPEGIASPMRVELQREACLAVKRKFNGPYYGQDVFLVSTDTLAGVKGMTPDELAREVGGRMTGWTYGTPNPQIVRDLTPGRYTVFVMLARFTILASKEVEYKGGYQEVEIELPELSRDQNIVLRVFGPDDKPLDGATVEIWVDPEMTARAAIERGNGEYWVKRIPPGNLTWGGKSSKTEYGITVTHPMYGTRVITCPVDTRQEQTVKFTGKCSLTVILDNLPAEHGTFELAAIVKGESESRAFDSYRGPRLAKASNDFELAAGPVVVVLRINPGPSQGYGQSVILWREELELAPGKRVLRINVPQLGDLRLRVPEGVEAPWVTVKKDAMQRSVQPDAAGIVEFKQLPPGSYLVSCDAGSMTLELPVYSEVVLKLQPYNALRVSNAPAGSAMQQAGLQTGDVIRQINGASLSGSSTALREVLQHATDNGDATLLVQRGQQTITVTATAAQWKALSPSQVTGVRID